MPTYEGYVYKTTNSECRVTVEANTEEEAQSKIYAMIDENRFVQARFTEIESDLEFDGFVEETK